MKLLLNHNIDLKNYYIDKHSDKIEVILMVMHTYLIIGYEQIVQTVLKLTFLTLFYFSNFRIAVLKCIKQL